MGHCCVMSVRSELPSTLGAAFSVAEARRLGVGAGRLRAADVAAPFKGMRLRVPAQSHDTARNEFEAAEQEHLDAAHAYAAVMRRGEFFCYETAVLLWGGPRPHGPISASIDVAVLGDDDGLPRATNVRGRRLASRSTRIVTVQGLRVATPASTWAMLGRHWSVDQLTAFGDYACRIWREGVGRPGAELPPLARIDQFAAALASSRRVGAAKLRESLDLIRCDSWSPRETGCRLALLRAGLPEPLLNLDVFDETGSFIGCTDMAYPDQKVAIEYQGRQHAETYADDVERAERFRAAGWIMIQVTSAAYDSPRSYTTRVRQALVSRGWPGLLT